MWVRLDDNFADHPKVLAAGVAGAGLFALALSYCGRQRTDGFVPAQWVAGRLHERADHKKLPQLLTDLKLWEPVEGGFWIRDFVQINPSKAELDERARKRREAGLRGAEARWADGKSHGKSHGDRTNASMEPEPEHRTPNAEPENGSDHEGRPSEEEGPE